MGSSSRENLKHLVGEDSLLYQETHGFTDIPEQHTVIDSDNYGFLWHSNCGGTLHILPGTQLHIGDTVFLIKGSEILSNSPNVYVTDTVIDNGGRNTPLTIVHLMESDDAGQTNEISLHHDYKWAICHMSPEKRSKISDVPTAQPNFYFKDETLTGNFYNSVNTAVQLLNLDFDHCTVTGQISSGDCEHIYKSYWYGMKDGEKICIDENGRAYLTLWEAPYTSRSMGGASVTRVYVHPVVNENGAFVYDTADPRTYEKVGYAVYYRDAQYISKVFVTPSETVNNPVAVTLHGESIWTVTAPSYLRKLTMENGSRINGKLFVNGVETALLPDTYEGSLLVTEP